MPMKNTTAPLVAMCFLNKWTFPQVIPNSVLIENVSQFIAQIFPYVWVILGTKRILITPYHPQSNWKRNDTTSPSQLDYDITGPTMKPIEPFKPTIILNSQWKLHVWSVIDAQTSNSSFRSPSTCIWQGRRSHIICSSCIQTLFRQKLTRQEAIQRRRYYHSMVFLDHPKYERKPAKDRDEQISKSKLPPKTTGPFRVIRAYYDFIVADPESLNYRSPSTAAPKLRPKIQLQTTPVSHLIWKAPLSAPPSYC